MPARLLYLLLLLGLQGPFNRLAAQEEFVEAPARFLDRTPITLFTGGVVVLKARLEPFTDTLNFIFDTGSSGISLDSVTADYFGLKPGAPEKTIRGIAGMRRVGFLHNRSLRFNNLTVDSLNFHVNDYTVLTEVYGEKIDGIIGYSILSRYILQINYDSLFIDFYSPGMIRYPKGGTLFKPQIANIPIQAARVRDERATNSRFLYDVGAGLCVLFSSDFIKDSSLLKRRRRFYPKQGEGIGGKIDMQMTLISEFRLGPYKFRRVPVYIFDDQNNVTSYPQLAGLIGNDLLRRFNCILNYPKREFYLIPNTHFREPFDYAYSGLELYLINGVITVGDVAPGSPAAKAGIREGDHVLAVNNNFSQNLNQYKIALQATGQNVRLLLRRAKQLINVELGIKRIR
ncbi:aspartyl protease family protein [Nostoc ellipsosporum NOK]|nr:aspartyl protease family protein [Nostoc ellipsosporum NOK]